MSVDLNLVKMPYLIPLNKLIECIHTTLTELLQCFNENSVFG